MISEQNRIEKMSDYVPLDQDTMTTVTGTSRQPSSRISLFPFINGGL